MDWKLTGYSPNDNWIGFPFCTHFIISSITPSVKVRPKTSGNADEGLEGGAGKLPSDSPDCGMTREGILIVDLPENRGIRGVRGRVRGSFWLAAKSRRRWVTLNAVSTCGLCQSPFGP
jgi:hypothetical protein